MVILSARNSLYVLRGGSLNLETHSFAMLQKTDNFEEILCPRVSRWPEHPHEALRRDVRGLGKLRETDGRIDVVAQNGLGRSDIASDQGFNAFA